MIPEKYKTFADTNNGLSARPCFIPEIVKSLEDSLTKDFLFKENIFNEYVSVFKNYLLKDKYNHLLVLRSFFCFIYSWNYTSF